MGLLGQALRLRLQAVVAAVGEEKRPEPVLSEAEGLRAGPGEAPKAARDGVDLTVEFEEGRVREREAPRPGLEPRSPREPPEAARDGVEPSG